MSTVMANKWKCLGLESPPFSDFEQQSLSRVSSVDVMQSDVREFLKDLSSSLAVVSGPRGVGKTTACLDFINNIDNQHIRYVVANRGMTVHNFMKLITDVAMVEDEGSWSEPDRLLDHVVELLQKKDQKSVLVIDNSGELPMQSMSMMMKLIAMLPKHLYFKFLLIGQPIVFDRVQKFKKELWVNAEKVVDIQAKPFSFIETQQYVFDALYSQGWSGVPSSVPNDTLDEIYHSTNGVARQINHFAPPLLLNALEGTGQKEQEEQPPWFTKKKIMSVVLALTMGTSLYAGGFFSSKKKVEKKEVQVNAVQVASFGSNAPKKSAVGLQKEPLRQKDKKIKAQKKELIQEDPPIPSEYERVVQESLIKSDTWSEINLVDKMDYDREQLKGIDGYLIQVAAVSTLPVLERTFKVLPLDESSVYIYHGIRRDMPTYVILQGHYPTIEQARAALTKLPEGIKKQHPWVRTASSVRQDIRRFQMVLSG